MLNPPAERHHAPAVSQGGGAPHRARGLAYNPSTRNFRSRAPVQITFTLNGDPVDVVLKTGDRLLIDVLREDLRLTGTKHGCGIGACGICTVLVNGAPVASCLQLAALCDGADVCTIEGLASASALHAVQQAFVNRSALQCGICIPGHVVAACALLTKNPQPSAEEIRASIDSVYCRCTGYVRIMEAYKEAMALMRKAQQP
jgi:aerobic-type carbon monoxide dehydrogenase small subunit (CoxS/CutS family)